MSDLTILRVQRELKPKIEDVMPFYLDGEELKTALDFVAYLRTNKMSPTWAGVHNSWTYSYKGKGLYNIMLRTTNILFVHYDEGKKWFIEPYLRNLSKYDDKILDVELQCCLWDNVSHCRNFLMGGCNYHGCAPGMSKTIAGKAFNNICSAHASVGRRVMVAYDPSEATIDCIKKLLEFEREARLYSELN